MVERVEGAIKRAQQIPKHRLMFASGLGYVKLRGMANTVMTSIGELLEYFFSAGEKWYCKKGTF